MYHNRYNKVLTIMLIVLIVAIVIIGLIFGIKALQNMSDKKDRERVLAKLEERSQISENEIEQEEVVGDTNRFYIPIEDVNQSQQETSSSSGGGSGRKKAVMYKSYPVAGYIKISKINLSYPILSDCSPGALDTAISIQAPPNAKLNEPGNVVLIGHNYKNGKFFANNKKLEVGDKIEITDENNRKLTYTIYKKFVTTESDSAYVTRATGNNIEISLSTCTDDGQNRLVILARVE